MARHHTKKIRSAVKTITWRTIATAATAVLVWIFTGNLIIAGAISGAEVIIKMILYYLHERTWDLIPWGYEHE